MLSGCGCRVGCRHHRESSTLSCLIPPPSRPLFLAPTLARSLPPFLLPSLPPSLPPAPAPRRRRESARRLTTCRVVLNLSMGPASLARARSFSRCALARPLAPSLPPPPLLSCLSSRFALSSSLCFLSPGEEQWQTGFDGGLSSHLQCDTSQDNTCYLSHTDTDSLSLTRTLTSQHKRCYPSQITRV